MSHYTLGFVASVGADGRVNLSPKGTFVILDDETLIFSEIRSPNTVRNIKVNPEVEINFIDPFVRKGVRVRGMAQVIEKAESEYGKLFPLFAGWGELTTLIRRIIKIKITQAKEISSPIYDIGATEQEMVDVWSEKYRQTNGFG